MTIATAVRRAPSQLAVVTRRALIGTLAFGSVSAIAGGVLGIVANGAGVPLRYLAGSPFDSFVVPGLLLGLVIGGTQVIALLGILRRWAWSLVASVVAGAGMLIWIFVELAIIREYSVLQTIYFAVGLVELFAVFGMLGLVGSRPKDLRH